MNKLTITRGARRRRAAVTVGATLLALLALAMVLPLNGIWLAGDAARAQPDSAQQQPTNPRADYWREVRQGLTGYTAVQGQETNVLIQNGGQNWREIRNGPVANYGGWFLALAVLGIALFHILHGPLELEKGRSGNKILRWTAGERVMHWYTATLFVVLAITGLSLLFGRALLIPVIGHQAFSAYADVAKLLHNFLGPLFLVGILMEIFYWMRFSLPRKEDWEWFKRGGGGIVGKGHGPAGKMNGGEKIWFWVIFWIGLTISVTGLIMDFPNFGQTRETMQIADVIHVVAGAIFMAFAMAHIYIGTLGTKGALEGMITGYVDVNWAKQHHDLWYEEKTRRALAGDKPRGTATGTARPATGDS